MRALLHLAVVALLVAPAVLFVACDAAAPAAPEVRLISPFPSLDLGLADSAAFALGAYFASNPADAGLAFAVEVEGDAVAAEVRGDSLTIQSLREGAALVRVTARASSGREATGAMNVTVRAAACPPGGDADEADFLPLVQGATWRFAFVHESQRMWARQRDEGTLTLVLHDVSCANGTRTVNAEEHREGLRVSTNDATGTADTTALDEHRAVVLTETADGVQLPWAAGVVPRYHPADADTIRVKVGPIEGCATYGSTATLVPGALAGLTGGCVRASHSVSLMLSRLPPGL